MSTDWRDLSPAEVLESHVVLTLEQTAYVLGLVHTRGAVKGQLSTWKVAKLVAAGKLRLVDADQERSYWRISVGEVIRYRDGATAPRRPRSVGAA